MSSALPKRLKDSLATRPEIQITHTRVGRQSLAPVDIFIAAMRNRWFNERSAVSDKEGKQAVSLLDGMEIV